jgi:2,3-bisphosphoglycerate-dependent phosphoglycerate mutase
MPFASSPEEHIDRIRMSFNDPEFALIGGESFREAAARALACLRQLIQETPSGLLLVGHGQCLTLILRFADLKADFEFWNSLPTPAIVELTIDHRSNRGSFRLVDIHAGSTDDR